MKESLIDELDKSTSELLSTETNRLVQNISTPQRGVLIYHEIIPAIDELKEIIREVDKEALRRLPFTRLKRLRDLLDPIFKRIKQIQSTDKDPNQPDEAQKRQTVRFFTSPRTQDEAFYERNKEEIWNLIIEAITLRNKDILSASKLVEIVTDVQAMKGKADVLYTKLESIVKTSQEELAKGGVGAHAKLFQEQADRHFRSSANWRRNLIVVISLNATAILALYSLISYKVSDPMRKIEAAIGSLLVISLLSYAIVLCVRNYFAEKHNQLINQHKANCLETYNTFIESAPEDIKSAILLHATQTIFSHQNPGFLLKENLTQSPSPIMEIIRSATKSADIGK